MIRFFSVYFLSLLFGQMSLFSQSVGLQRETNFFTESIDLFNNNDIYHSKIPDDYQGTPYYFTSFLLGNVYMNNELLERNVALRYNVYADEIEFRKTLDKENTETFAIIKSEDIYVTINNETIIFKATKGYFIAVYDGTNFSLLKKITKKYYPFKKAATSLTNDVPAIFIDKFNYYLATKDGILVEFSGSKNKKLKVFDEKYNQAKAFIKEKSLDTNKERDLKRLITYLDGLSGSKL